MSDLVHRLAELGRLAERFRVALEACERSALGVSLERFPVGACGDASLLLGKYLEENSEKGIEYVWGIASQTHGWLELDGFIIDITADQFEGISDRVVVTRCSTWHQKFESQLRRPLNTAVDVDASPSLSAAFREIMRVLKTAH